jgi:hypothetical protein
MNTSVDLDINNYNTSDLLKFLKLNEDYGLNDIEQKTNEMTNELLFSDNISSNDKKYKTDIIGFIKLAKDVLISTYNDIQTEIEIKKGKQFGKDNNLGKIINPLSVHQALQPHSIPNKSAISYKHDTIRSIYVFNTIARDNFFGSISVNCTFDLPIKLTNVISLTLSSIQIPNIMFTFDRQRGNVSIYIFENNTGVGEIITIPDGNYSRSDTSSVNGNVSMATTLETAINLVFNTHGLPLNRFSVLISGSTGRTTISNLSSNFSIKTLNPADNYYCSPYTKPKKDSADSKTGITPTRYIANLGYYLGFRESSYSNSNSYTSEGVFDSKYSSYLYFALNDYTGSQAASNTYALFQNSFLADQLLAIVPLNGPRFDYIYDNGANFIYKQRDYFGPVDISKISIKLLNQLGELVNLLDSEFSFSLEVTTVYDLNKHLTPPGQVSNII